jgi:hypothetical protein
VSDQQPTKQLGNFVATTGQKPWPPVGTFVAAHGQFSMAVVTPFPVELLRTPTTPTMKFAMIL